jgi:hypothetical protein
MDSNYDMYSFYDVNIRFMRLEDKLSSQIKELSTRIKELEEDNSKLQMQVFQKENATQNLKEEFNKLETKLLEQIVKTKQYALGLTGGTIKCDNYFHSINRNCNKNEVTESLCLTNQFNLNCLPGLEKSGLTKFKLKEGLMFISEDQIVKIKDAINIIKFYGYEIIYECPDKKLDLNKNVITYS